MKSPHTVTDKELSVILFSLYQTAMVGIPLLYIYQYLSRSPYLKEGGKDFIERCIIDATNPHFSGTFRFTNQFRELSERSPLYKDVADLATLADGTGVLNGFLVAALLIMLSQKRELSLSDQQFLLGAYASYLEPFFHRTQEWLSLWIGSNAVFGSQMTTVLTGQRWLLENRVSKTLESMPYAELLEEFQAKSGIDFHITEMTADWCAFMAQWHEIETKKAFQEEGLI